MADIERAWPECPPYGGAFDPVIHHLTVARDLPPAAEREVEEQLSRELPISARIDHALLIAFDADSYDRVLAGSRDPVPSARVLATLRFSNARRA